METAIAKINPSDFGLTEAMASNILKDLPTIIEERAVMIEEYKRIITLNIEDPATARAAADIRKLIKNNRTKGIEIWHKVNKEYFLRGGQFVDAIKRKEVAENERMENALLEIENYREIKEGKRIADLQIVRQTETAKYEVDGTMMPLGQMSDEVWNNYISGVRMNFEKRKEDERKAEEERIAKVKAEADERERIRIENEKLKEENKKQAAKIESEILYQKEIVAKAEAEQKRIQKEADEKAAKAKAEADEKLKTEREAKEKLEKELKAKADAEAKAKAEMEAKAEAELSKSDKDKFAFFLIELKLLTEKYQFKSKKYQGNYSVANQQINKIINHFTN